LSSGFALGKLLFVFFVLSISVELLPFYLVLDFGQRVSSWHGEGTGSTERIGEA
jgi:hypothetical protein